jgi:hypothetical protein
VKTNINMFCNVSVKCAQFDMITMDAKQVVRWS